jgi:hypothetical protein
MLFVEFLIGRAFHMRLNKYENFQGTLCTVQLFVSSCILNTKRVLNVFVLNVHLRSKFSLVISRDICELL